MKPIRLCKCGNKHLAKGLCKKCYDQLPEVKEKARIRRLNHYHKPEIKKQILEYEKQPEIKLKKLAYSRKTEVKKRCLERQQTEKYRKKQKEYREILEHKIKMKKYLKKYFKNPIKRKQIYDYYKNRYRNDILYNLQEKMRGRLYSFLRVKKINKNNKTMTIVGCTPHKLKKHIEKQFTIGMSWKDVLSGYIHIDHIVPLYTAKTEKDIYKLCHYSNLQPLWAMENYIKNRKLNW